MIDFKSISENIELNKYKLIGSGTGRIVFDLGNGYVVKAAKNRKGFAQNKAEYQISLMQHTDLFAKILEASDDYRYLVMEKAERIKTIAQVWNYYHVRNNRELFQLEEFRDFPKKYNLLYPDLLRQTSWGTINGKPVIIDFGFTQEVRKYYSLF